MSRKNISLSEPIQKRAKAIIFERGFNGLSDLIGTLIREDFERRFGPVKLSEIGVSSATGAKVATDFVAALVAGAEATKPPAQAQAAKRPPARRSKKRRSAKGPSKPPAA